jgi:uncharacterized delta-60 repeat protein
MRGARGVSVNVTLRAAIVLACAAFAAARVALAAPGDLDPSFGDLGRTTVDFGSSDSARAVAVQPDGKIVVAGYGNSSIDIAVARLEPDGSLDPSFDGDGRVTIDFGDVDVAEAVALQPDGKIVVAGYTTVNLDVVVVRLRPDGSLDPDFDGDGKKTIDYAGGDQARGVVVQPDGKIVVAGVGGPGVEVAVTRLNPDGSFDETFDGDGTAGVDFGGSDQGSAVALQADGRIVVVGYTSVNDQALALRLDENGALDPTFGVGGKWNIGYGGSSLHTSVALQPDGKIVIGGVGGPLNEFAFARLDPMGALDPTFAEDGARLLDLGGDDYAADVVLQPNGKIVLAGDFNNDDFAFLRLNPDGSIDLPFDGVGVALIDLVLDADCYGAALQPDGKIVAAGRVRFPGEDDFAIARIEGDPLVTTTTTLPPPTFTDHPIPLDLAVVKPGKLVKLVAKGSLTLPDPAVDSPTSEGGALSLVGTTGSVTYALGAGSWTALGRRHDGTKGYRFAGAGCATVLLKRSVVKAVCRGSTGTLSIPEPGPLTAVLTIGGTTRYCGTCAGTAQGNAARVFKRRACTAPAGCP